MLNKTIDNSIYKKLSSFACAVVNAYLVTFIVFYR